MFSLIVAFNYSMILLSYNNVHVSTLSLMGMAPKILIALYKEESKKRKRDKKVDIYMRRAKDIKEERGSGRREG